MAKNKYIRIGILVFIIAVAFTVFFADGYSQWVNSDTAAEAYGITQDVRFPQGLFSDKQFRCRLTGHWLSFVPFNVVGSIYKEFFHDPVSSLYVSQGVITGTIYVFLVLVSAAYISSSSKLYSSRYLISAIAVLLFIIVIPPNGHLDSPFGINVRFLNQAVMTNYVGTLVIALGAIFPYWRRLFTGEWDGFYNNIYARIGFYVLLTAAVFSSTATTVWLTVSSSVAMYAYTYCWSLANKPKSIKATFNFITRDSICHSFLFISLLGTFAIGLESHTKRASDSTVGFDFVQYLKAYFSFFAEGIFTYILAFLIIACLILYRVCMKRVRPQEIDTLFRILPWLIIANIVFIFVIGIPRIPYRFEGYNLGIDTSLIAAWTFFIWFLAVISSFWKERLSIYFMPTLLFVVVIYAVHFFPLAENTSQKQIFDLINAIDKRQPVNKPLFVPSSDISWGKAACEEYTIPMLRNVGIISQKRTIIVTQ